MRQQDFHTFLEQCQQRVNRCFEEKLSTLAQSSPRLMEAVRYSSLNAGKRVRPVLAYAAAQAVSEITPATDQAALAVEMIHAYSLIHDDLPAMDDDALRRGQPTCHIQFDEATAILAADGLQALAFECLCEADMPASYRLAMVRELSRAAGLDGMVGGQALDLEATDQSQSLEQLERIHRLKTGVVIRAAVRLGAITSGSCSDRQLADLSRYADAIGLAFQVQDDILDVVADTQTLGKQQGADEALNKATYVRLLGLDGARSKAQQLLQEALEALAGFGERAETLRQLAHYIVERRH